MYSPSHFNEHHPASLHRLIETHPLGAWAVSQSDGIEINHIPFLLDATDGPHGTLLGHVARANPVWKTCSLASSVVIFCGEHGYISPSWYVSKQEHHRVVPTWNYAVTHAHGIAEAVEDRHSLLSLITRLTDAHEARQTSPWRITDAPIDYIDTMLGAIVGIRIRIQRLEGKFKLSQNRSDADRRGVIAALATSHKAGDNALATLMSEHCNSQS